MLKVGMPLTVTGTQACSGGLCELQSLGCITDLLTHLKLAGTAFPPAQLELSPHWGSRTSCPEAACVSRMATRVY